MLIGHGGIIGASGVAEQAPAGLSVIGGEAITFAQSQTPASQDITIPSDATAVYVFLAGWTTTDGNDLTTFTLNSASASQSDRRAVSGNMSAIAWGAWYSPATGRRALAIGWSAAAPSEGPAAIAVYVKGGNVTAARDTDLQQVSTQQTSFSLTTEADDLVIAYDQKYGATPPSLSSGWTNIVTNAVNSHAARARYIVATGASQTVNGEDEDYSSLAAVAIPPL